MSDMQRREQLAIMEATEATESVKAMHGDIAKWRTRVDALLVEYEEEDAIESTHWRMRLPSIDKRDMLSAQRGSVMHQLEQWERNRQRLVQNIENQARYNHLPPLPGLGAGDDYALTEEERHAVSERMSMIPLIAEEEARDARNLENTRAQLTALGDTRRQKAGEFTDDLS
ncbi:hypothetical protein T492DRAFT_871541 [Pavlovales sp. CCMP2436]|nr:hypothetical protein T492DRAFT_871541 [Pavlovales sp. CCMP2436]